MGELSALAGNEGYAARDDGEGARGKAPGRLTAQHPAACCLTRTLMIKSLDTVAAAKKI